MRTLYVHCRTSCHVPRNQHKLCLDQEDGAVSFIGITQSSLCSQKERGQGFSFKMGKTGGLAGGILAEDSFGNGLVRRQRRLVLVRAKKCLTDQKIFDTLPVVTSFERPKFYFVRQKPFAP
jgi:hypothetical protein